MKPALQLLRNLWRGPTIASVLARRLHHTRLELLQAEELAEYYTAMTAMLRNRLTRLQTYSSDHRDPQP
jgi:hypothetical protein